MRTGKYPLLLALSLQCAASAAQANATSVVVAGSGTHIGNVSREQLTDIFLGRSTRFPDGSSVTLLDQPENSKIRDEFYSHVLGKSSAQVKSYWAKLSFTGKGVPPKEGRNSDDIKKQVNSAPGTIGYIDQAEVDATVKIVFQE